MFRLVLTFVLFYTSKVLSFDVYEGSAGPKSTQYSATLTNNGKTYTPHVYGIDCPSWCGNKNDKSANNWIEFEQSNSDTTTVVIDRLIGKWPSNTHIRPISYGIDIKFSNNDNTVTFDVKGNALHFSVHYGNDSDTEDPDGSLQSSMLIFVTPPNIAPSPTSNTKVWKAGEYKLTDGGYPAGTGVFAVNDTTNSDVDMIILERGAWVYGKVYINKKINIYGPGIISGRYFSYDERKNESLWNQNIMLVNAKGNEIEMVGVTLVTPNYRLFDNCQKLIRYYRGIGWSPNNGQGHLNSGCVEEDSFVRSYDDLIKPAQNVITRRLVIWQGYNGGSYQFGWHGYDVTEAVKNYDWTIIADENEVPTTYDGYDNTRTNNGIISCVNPDGAELSGPFEFYNMVADGDIRNFFVLTLDTDGYLKNLNFYNLTIRGKIDYFNMIQTNPQNNTAKISNINFHNFTINGKLIMDLNDTALKMYITGNVDTETIKFYQS